MTLALRWARVHDDGPAHAWPPGQDAALWEALCGLVRAEPDRLRDGDVEQCVLCRIMLGENPGHQVPVSRWME